MGATSKAFTIIIKTTSYLLKINKKANKNYLRNSNFEMHFIIYDGCFLASR